MFECIHIENYKCLRDVTVELGDFTILIGPNDSGKSS
jgi:AAA15 family ATPase/GTPase